MEDMTSRAVNLLLQGLDNSPQSAGRLLSIAERLAPAGELRDMVRNVHQMWEDDTPSARLITRTIQQLNPKARTRFVTNFLINNAWGKGYQRREQLLRDENFCPPFTILLSPSMRCNLTCTGCYASEYTRDGDMAPELIDRVLSEAKEMGIYTATILGGEPFVDRDMWDIYARHDDMYFLVFTNGTALTERNIARLADLGNVAVAVSIEGWQEDTDARRGAGTYQTLMQVFDHLREAGVGFGFSAMVTRHNVETICSDEFNLMLLEKGCLFGWNFLYMPIGREPDFDLMPTPEQREYLRTHGASRIRSTYPLFVMDFWNDAPYVGGCIAAKDYLHINTKGDVEPCIFTHFAVDNIHDKSLYECLTSPFFKAIRARQPYGENLLMPCMLIDHPHVFREVHHECQPYPTHTGAELLITELAGGLTAYSQHLKPLSDRAWQAEWSDHHLPVKQHDIEPAATP